MNLPTTLATETALPSTKPRIASMTEADLDRVYDWTMAALAKPQIPIRMEHTLHAGLYARTCRLPKDTAITGVLIKIPTLLVVHGDAWVYIGNDQSIRLTGYQTIPAGANRRQAFVALEETEITMMFPTSATSVEEAEHEFTDEFECLASHRDDLNTVTITGET